MNLPSDSLIAYALEKMDARLAARSATDDVSQVRSGLLYTGNIHDAIPRQLLLDTRLSPLDKMAWMMIRLYAQQNQGAIFPTYDELQLQLASPHKGKASRETVSRVLLMLRITGWLSLCKKVRDCKGRVRGNIYAQHDEPLSARDAEALDPGWLDMVAEACQNKNITISESALAVLQEVKDDPLMRHRHSAIGLMETRLGAAQSPKEMAGRQRLTTGGYKLGSETELSGDEQSSVSEFSNKSARYDGVREPNCNVRSSTHSVDKDTYVTATEPLTLPGALISSMADDDVGMLTRQLQALPRAEGEGVLLALKVALAKGVISNPVGWLLSVMKRAREGALYLPKQGEVAPPTTSNIISQDEVMPASVGLREPMNSQRNKHKSEDIGNIVHMIRHNIRKMLT